MHLLVHSSDACNIPRWARVKAEIWSPIQTSLWVAEIYHLLPPGCMSVGPWKGRRQGLSQAILIQVVGVSSSVLHCGAKHPPHDLTFF